MNDAPQFHHNPEEDFLRARIARLVEEKIGLG
jgi:hypothetical protein